MRWLCALAAFLTLLTGTLALTLPGSEVLAGARSVSREPEASSAGRTDAQLSPEQPGAAGDAASAGTATPAEAVRTAIGPRHLEPIDPNAHATLIVSVLDARGRPCAGAVVLVRIRPEQAQGYAMGLSVATDEHGEARAEVLASVPIVVGTACKARTAKGPQPSMLWQDVLPLCRDETARAELRRIE